LRQGNAQFFLYPRRLACGYSRGSIFPRMFGKS
jgi:hypothetical protein